MLNTYKNRPRRSDYSSDEHGLLQFALALNKWCVDSEEELRETVTIYKGCGKDYEVIEELLGDV